jgi:hypothetical protein
MFFVGLRTTGDLALTTPLEHCCNCGMRRQVELVETPLQKTRYFFIFGTEFSLNETFPYCRQCRKSATRIRLGWLSKILVTCLVIAAIFLAFAVSATSLPSSIAENMFRTSIIAGVLLTSVYFYFLEWGRKGSTYYQPVSLVDVDTSGGTVNHMKIRFYNKKYAGIFMKANAEMISSGILRVEVAGKQAN